MIFLNPHKLYSKNIIGIRKSEIYKLIMQLIIIGIYFVLENNYILNKYKSVILISYLAILNIE